MPHTPAVQVAVPLESLQILAQLPQWVGSVLKLTSQPLLARPSQLPKPVLQEIAQMPAEHEAVPLVEVQTFPQALQFETLVLRSTSQPLAALLSQLPKPEAHAIAQAPLVQEGVPLAELHTVPQALQLFGSALRSTSQPVEALLSQSS
jgi:hypothetical protein